jgi:hypothetical protein
MRIKVRHSEVPLKGSAHDAGLLELDIGSEKSKEPSR